MKEKFRKILTSKYILWSLILKLSDRYPRLISDKLYLRARFFFEIGHELDLKKPMSFNEKLQWLKLYQRLPIMTSMVDKYESKKYVAERIGDEYIIPTLGVWDNFDSIDFETLPEQFVLKTTHDSGGVIVVKDKSSLDKNEAKKILSKSLNTDFYLMGREWPYKNVPHRIIAEKYMEDETGELRDFKFFCFNGKVKALFIASDRFKKDEDTKFDFFDSDFNHLPFVNGHPNSNLHFIKPETFDKMKELAEILSKGHPHLRVDLYNINGRIYYGELTFFHNCGFIPFEPYEWDKKFGDWISLPTN